MDFSEEEKNEILETHFEKIKKNGEKKYIITIREEYVNLIDSMSIEERNETINDIISVHNDNINEQKQKKRITKITIGIIVGFLLLLFLAPFTLWLINYSFTMTQNNYSEMQNNFEVLYKNRK